jgi:hypothetical protein
MTQHFIGINAGQAQTLNKLGSAQTGTATTGTDMELRWDDTKPITRLELRQFTEFLEFFIENNAVPSALPVK